MKGINRLFQIELLILILIHFSSTQSESNTTSNETIDPKSKESIQRTINEILSEYHYENRTEISIEEFTQVFQRFMTKDLETDNSTNATSFEDDAFLKDLTLKITEGIPQQIKVEDIYNYISPEKIEKFFNELLGDMDLTNFFDKETTKDKETKDNKRQQAEVNKPKQTQSRQENEHTDL